MSVYTLKIHEDGSRTERWEVGGQLHRASGPALITVDREGRRATSWYSLGRLHRNGRPALTVTDDNGYKREEWFQNGQRHNDNGPAIITSRPGSIVREWWVNGERSEDPHSKPLDFNLPTQIYSLQADAYGYLTLWVDAGGDAPVPLARERDVNPGVWELLLKGAGNPQGTPKSA